MPIWNTLQFVIQLAPDADSATAADKLRNRLSKSGFEPYEGTPGSVRGTSLLTPPGHVLWAVTEEVSAPDADAALADLRARLQAAGFRVHASPRSLLFDGYELAFLSENQPDQDTTDENEEESG